MTPLVQFDDHVGSWTDDYHKTATYTSLVGRTME